MAQLPPIKRLTKEDMKDAPSWIDRLLFPLNQFLDSVYRALNGQIDFVDNIKAQRYSIQITAGASAASNTFKFKPTLKKRPEFILSTVFRKDVNYAPIGSAVYLDWYYDGEFVQVSSITGLTNTYVYSISLLVI